MTHDEGAKAVVYVLDNDLAFDAHDKALSDAQSYALAAKLPFAVVGVLTDDVYAAKQKEQLVEAEHYLAPLNIPLMLLVGKRENALKGLSAHISPLLVMPSGAHSKNELSEHPYAWPGHVEPVASVLRMVRDNPAICRF